MSRNRMYEPLTTAEMEAMTADGQHGAGHCDCHDYFGRERQEWEMHLSALRLREDELIQAIDCGGDCETEAEELHRVREALKEIGREHGNEMPCKEHGVVACDNHEFPADYRWGGPKEGR